MGNDRMLDKKTHPCFNFEARHKYARIHLPVAEGCNIQCRFCDRRFDCINESRPGVTSAVLLPYQALAYIDAIMNEMPNISVVAIAGPGDAFANPGRTIETMELVRGKYSEILFCVSTNGFGVLPYVDKLVDLGLTHITVTVNAVDPEIGEKIYAWARDGKRIYRGIEAATLIRDRQMKAVEEFAGKGVMVKVNTVLIPGVNSGHVDDIAKEVSKRGASIYNLMPLVPVEGTEFEGVQPLPADKFLEIRSGCASHLKQMTHCKRCRSDAAGCLNEPFSELVRSALEAASRLPAGELNDRPYIAVASREGVVVNQHLGETAAMRIYENKDGVIHMVDIRKTPESGGGDSRWDKLAELLGDCRAVLVSGVGPRPQVYLFDKGLRVIETEGSVEAALEREFASAEMKITVSSGCKRGFSGGGGCGGDGGGCAA